MPKKARTLAERLADLDDPAPKEELDPESFGGAFDRPPSESGEEESSTNEDDGREHYETVGESKLRRPEEAPLGKEYAGAKVSREQLMGGNDMRSDESDDPFASAQEDADGGSSESEDAGEVDDEGRQEEGFVDPDTVDLNIQADDDEEIDSDEAFGEGDEERFKGYEFRASKSQNNATKGKSKRKDDDLENEEIGEDEDEEDEEEEGGEDDDSDDNDGEIEAEDEDIAMDDGEGIEISGESESNLGSDEDATDEEDYSGSDIDDNDDEESSDTDVSQEKDAGIDRVALKNMMAESTKSIVADMSVAMKADVSKGRAVTHQRSTFDSLLNTRIKLQKALISTNSLAHPSTPGPTFPSDAKVIEAAESAALQLLNSLADLRASLPPTPSSTKPDGSSNNNKRPLSATLTTPLPIIHSHIRSLDASTRSRARPTLAKWAAKTHLAGSTVSGGTAEQQANKRFSSSAGGTAVRPLTDVLDSQLVGPNMDRLRARTRVPRGCAPLQAAEDGGRKGAGKVGGDGGYGGWEDEEENDNGTNGQARTEESEDERAVYDDADWYALLLQELVAAKMSSSTVGPSTSSAGNNVSLPSAHALSLLRAQNKTHRRGLDVKASKGRRLRYTVHERLLNFMAPEDRGNWERRRAEELFAGLLGRKVRGGLGEENDDGDDDDGSSSGDAAEGEALRLFAGGP